jgi:hypothetical protein
MAHNPVFTPVDDNGNTIGSTGGTATAAVAAGPGNTVIKAGPGRLNRVVVTAASTTGVLTFYDNASTAAGTILAIIPGSVAQGTAYDIQMPAAVGIVAAGATGSAAVTVSYS